MSKLFKQSVHSDIIIHWTGRDFDPSVSIEPEGGELQWHELKDNRIRDVNVSDINAEVLKDKKRKVFPKYPQEHPSFRLGAELENKYIDRLIDILRFGLWLTNDQAPEKLVVNTNYLRKNKKQYFSLPIVSRICFTELKLSESRTHAYKFGRLGIGVKRLFLSERGGQPMHYVSTIGSCGESLFFPPHVPNDALQDPKYAFFKNMSPPYDLNYDFYSESEWRIVYHSHVNQDDFVNPKGNLDVEFTKYRYKNTTIDEFKDYCAMNGKLQYLIPLDQWLAMIIYPSPEVKNMAQRNCTIRKLIRNIKMKNARQLKGPAYEKFMMPIEMDLDVCNHF